MFASELWIWWKTPETEDSLVSQPLNEGDVDHIVSLLKEKKAKTHVGHKQEERVTHISHTVSLLSSSSILSYRGFPSADPLCLLVCVCVCACAWQPFKVGSETGGRSSYHVSEQRVCWWLPRRIWIKCQWKTGREPETSDIQCVTWGTSFRFLWNFSVVKESLRSRSHSPPSFVHKDVCFVRLPR